MNSSAVNTAIKPLIPLLTLTGVLTAILLISPTTVGAADLVWTNSSGGNWNVAANWFPNQVPAAVDRALITNNGTYAVTLNANATVGTLLLGGDSGTQTLTNNGVTLTLTNTSVVGANGVLGLSGGALAGAGNLSVNGQFFWTGGTISGLGVRTIASGGRLTLNGSATKALAGGAALVNVGAASWNGGLLRVGGDSVLSNAPGATFEIAADVSFEDWSGVHTTHNAGVFRKTGGTGTTDLLDTFNNSGVLEVQSGTVRFVSGGGTHSGNVAVAANARLEFAGGTHSLGVGSSISLDGTLAVNGGTLNLSGGFTGAGPVIVSAGRLNAGNGARLTVASLNLNGGTVGGTGLLSVAGPLVWTSGGLDGLGMLRADGGLEISGPARKSFVERTLVNTATAIWSNGNLFVGGDGSLSNAPGATFEIAADVSFEDNWGGFTTHNAGVFRKTGGTGTTELRDTFNNAGTFEVQSGTVRFASGGGVDSGSFAVATGASLEFAGGTHSFTSGSSVSGAGNVLVSGAGVNFAGAWNATGLVVLSSGSLNPNNAAGITLPNLTMSGGTLGGTGPVGVSGPLDWSNGGFNGSGLVHANGGLTIIGSGTKNFSGRTLVNAALAAWSGGLIRVGGNSVLSNAPGATFEIAADVSYEDWSGGHITHNAGVWRKAGGSGTSTLVDPFNNTGTVEVPSGMLHFRDAYTQTAGQTRLNGGALANDQTLRILGGILVGTGMISGSVTSGGTVSPGASPGTLAIAQNYTQNSGGTLQLDIEGTLAGTQYDRLAVGGTATLGGSLVLTKGGGFLPTTNDLFTVLTAASRVGAFASATSAPPVYALQTTYASTQVVVRFIPPAIAIMPAAASVVSGETESFTVVGGVPPFAFSLSVNSSGGYIHPTSGVYTAGSTSGVEDTVHVMDSLGSSADATVSVELPPPPIVVVSGTALDGGGFAISNAELTVSTEAEGVFVRVFSSMAGTYAVDLPESGSFTITVSHPQYTFAPASVTLSNLTTDQVVNFTGTLIIPEVSGYVRDFAGAGLANVTLALQQSGQRASRRGVTSGTGEYRFSGLIAGASYTLMPASTLLGFDPPSVVFTASTGAVTADFTGRVAVTVSGRLTNDAGVAFAGALVSFEDATTRRRLGYATTRAAGDFTSPLLSTGLTCRVRPVLPGVVFSPATRTVGSLFTSVSGVDFTGVSRLFTVSGVITNSHGAFLNGGTVQVTGSTNRVVTVSATGRYSIPGVPAGLSCTVTPSRSDFTFSPAQIEIPLVTNNVRANFACAPPYTLPGRIAFRNGASLQVMNADATDLITLGSVFPSDWRSDVTLGPALSPDGRSIAYHGSTSTNFGIHVMNSGGGPATLVAGAGEAAYDPDWSLDGTRVVYALRGSNQRPPSAFGLWVRHLAASTEFRIPNTIGIDRFPDFAPDGESLLFVRSDNGIKKISTNGVILTAFTTGSRYDSWSKWAPGGGRFVFSGYSGASNRDIHFFELSSSNTIRLTASQAIEWKPDWSPDGSMIVYETIEAGMPKIAVMRADGSGKTFLADGSHPTWSVTPTVATPIGNEVTVTGSVVTVSFSEVTTGGVTTVLPVPSVTAAPPPGYFTIPAAGTAFEIATTASNVGPIKLCFTLPATMSSNAFQLARVLHVEIGALVDRTILTGPHAPNFATKTICAEVGSLSPFLLAMLADPQLPVIHGVVVDSSGQGLPDVLVEVDGPEPLSLFTDIDGAFAFVNLTPGSNHTVRASRAGFAFAPPFAVLDGFNGTNTLVFVGQVETGPVLTIELESLNVGLVRLTWSQLPGGFVLESTTNLATSWTVVPGNPTAANGQYQLSLPVEFVPRFFRLRND